jgi:hypothetical protein
MSRAAVQDNSTDFSLFPFLAVLLCAMGALIVVLIGVSRMSRDQAREQVARKRSESVSQPAPTVDRRSQLDQVAQYVARLQQVRGKAERQLRDDQLRLRDLEDHMRRLQNQAASLGVAAAELDALEHEHHDDREQAKREAARLEKLIADTRESIEELKKEVSRPRSYAVVPYKGPNGTYRPPIYIECRKNVVILQPEGIRLTHEDFRPPLGPGNPLAAALRAARAHYARQYPDAEIGSEHDPYPLILVRPDGIAAYYIVRKAIESWDSNFGYEMVNGDWDLAFPPPNSELATAESQAIELARLRMRMLAEAAPRAYSTVDAGGRGVFPSSAGDVGREEFNDGDGGGGYGDGEPASAGGIGLSGGGSGDGEPGDGGFGFGQPEEPGLAGNASTGEPTSAGGAAGGGDGSSDGGTGSGELVDGNGHGSDGATALGGNGTGASAADSGSLAADGSPGGAATGSGQSGPSGVAAGQSTTGSPGESASTGGAAGESASAGGAAGGAACATAGGAAGNAAGATVAAGSAAAGSGADSMQAGSTQDASNSLSMVVPDKTQQDSGAANSRSKGLDPPHKQSDSVPIRRPIHLVVRGDRVAILPDGSTTSDPLTGGKEIPLSGRTEASLDQVVSALRTHVGQWGMAGRGMFWRPVVVLDVGPDGQQRAQELVQLLKRRGIVLRYVTTAKHDAGNNSNATR